MTKKTGRIEERRPVSVEAKRRALEERQMTERDHVRPGRAFRDQVLYGEERESTYGNGLAKRVE